jgi:hypothetical protein
MARVGLGLPDDAVGKSLSVPREQGSASADGSRGELTGPAAETSWGCLGAAGHSSFRDYR